MQISAKRGERTEMEARKQAIAQKMKEKGMSVAQLAQSIGFDPLLLGLYLVQDAYPVPTRIIDKVEAALQ
jgi:hypothetical protein